MYSNGIYRPGGEREKFFTNRAQTGCQINGETPEAVHARQKQWLPE